MTYTEFQEGYDTLKSWLLADEIDMAAYVRMLDDLIDRYVEDNPL